ncbi:ABC transporter ATP-binding protein [Macrococcus sp. DPC7161]|uniref:ABC transporter ATP-binding protein n=1 Tax=Macrococcus sp. DPC7161 TaxID=2507060 RepID=UPI00100A4721|nr:ABC transporter ATP-binding protein [Macrococcus sp. DPC7161]RXK18618.1 ABC transporter ATP-binding protein [Macrococcus sp. DPC7161]
MDKMIELTHLKKQYGNKKAVDTLSFDVKTGEIFGLLGPSGSGKTTTIKMLTGETSITSGDAKVMHFNKEDLHKDKYRKSIGILSDNSALYERLTVKDNLKMFVKIYNKPVSNIEKALNFVDLVSEKNTVVKSLSKGMKQRILLAKALIHEPKLLFLDEPTSALDPNTTMHIHKGLLKLKEQGTTIFLTTHNMQEAETLCDRIALINNGRLIALDKPDALKYQYSNKHLHVTLKDQRTFELPQTEETANQIKHWMLNDEIRSIHSDEPTLNEVFIQLTGKGLV